eukprot:475825_1
MASDLNFLRDSIVNAVKEECFIDNCESIEQCGAINRIIKYLNEYQNNNAQFQNANYPYLTDDFNHVLIKHLTENHRTITRNKEFESIHNYIMTKVHPCNLENCHIYIRNNRNRETENILSNDSTESHRKLDKYYKYKLETMDTMHCFLIHSFDTGFRIRTDVFTANDSIKQKDSSNELHTNDTMTKLYTYLKTKRELVQNIRGTERSNNTKFVTNMNAQNEMKQKDNNTGTLNDYSFGNEYDYWIQIGKKPFIRKKFSNLRQEVLHNKIFTIDKTVFSAILYKAKGKLSSQYAKSLKVEGWIMGCRLTRGAPGTRFESKDYVPSPMTLEHLLSVLLYTDLDKLSYYFSSTFRSLTGSTLEEDAKRNAEYANWSRFLIETVSFFGTSVNESHIETYYHGINCKLIFTSFCSKCIGPTSTTAQLSVACIFAKSQGMILEFQNGSTHMSFKYFNCSWVSCFSNEDERLFIFSQWPDNRLIITGLRDMKLQKNYTCYMHALISLTDIVVGITREYKQWEESKFDIIILRQLFQHFDTRISYKNKLPTYINNLFAAFVQKITHIKISLSVLNAKYPRLKSLFFDDNPEMIKLVTICNIFNQCTSIHISYGKCGPPDWNMHTDMYFDETCFDSVFSKIQTLNSNKNVMNKITIQYIKPYSPETFDKYQCKLEKLGYSVDCKYINMFNANKEPNADIVIEFVGKYKIASLTEVRTCWGGDYDAFYRQQRHKFKLLICNWMRRCGLGWNKRKYFSYQTINDILDYYDMIYRNRGGTQIYWIEQNKDGILPNDNSKVDIEYIGYCCNDNDEKFTNILFTGDEKEFVRRRETLHLNSEHIVSGLRNAMKNINEGSKVKIWVPRYEAYKGEGFKTLVPPNCDLLFVLTLHKVINDPSKTSIDDIEQDFIPDVETLNWTNKLYEAINNKLTKLEMHDLTEKDINTIDWDLLIQCVSVTWLNIKMKKSVKNIEFPNQIFQMKNLKYLTICDYPFKFLSSNLGNLSNLESLSITTNNWNTDLNLICLPQTIGTLAKLSSLALTGCNKCHYIPYEILNCKIESIYKSGVEFYGDKYAYGQTQMLLPPLPKPKIYNNSNNINIFNLLLKSYGFTSQIIDI